MNFLEVTGNAFQKVAYLYERESMRAVNHKPVKVGDQFGSWTIITEDWYDKGKNATLVEVQCKCGSTKTIRKYTIQKGISQKCRKCMGRESFTGYENLGGYHINQIQRSAKKRNLDYSVTPKYLWELLEQQNFKCALTGVDLTLSRTIDNKTKVQTASLDRIDSGKGYIPGNVRWVHKIINQMRSNRSDSEFIEWCLKVSTYNNKSK